MAANHLTEPELKELVKCVWVNQKDIWSVEWWLDTAGEVDVVRYHVATLQQSIELSYRRLRGQRSTDYHFIGIAPTIDIAQF